MEQFHFPAHIVNARRNGHHHMIVRGDHTQLTEHTIAAVAVLPGAPELIPVPLMPFVFGFRLAVGIVDLLRRSQLKPFRRQHLTALPYAALNQANAETQNAVRRKMQPPSAAANALRAAVPIRLRDAQRRKQTRH